MAIPAMGRLIGMPASIMDSDALHTVAMDEDPLDSRISDTMRTTYGKSSSEGMTALSEVSAKYPCPTERRDGEPMRPTSPTQYGGKL